MSTTRTKERGLHAHNRSPVRALAGGSALVAAMSGTPALLASPVPASAASVQRAMGGVQCGGTSSEAGLFKPTGPHIAKVRVANFYLNPNGTPSATLDLYDTSRPTKSDKPLISGLAYGQISGYVSPRAEGPESLYSNGGDYAQLLHLPRTAARPGEARWTACSPGRTSPTLAG